MKRELLRETLTTILPTFLIIVVTLTSSLFGIEHFDAIVAVNVTAFLVIVTLFIGISTHLPRTPSIKMIDVWMIFAMFVPLCVVLLQTRIKTISKEGKIVPNKAWESHRVASKQKQILEAFSLFGLPAIFISFVIGFFAIGLYSL